jgi:hypothetical protein
MNFFCAFVDGRQWSLIAFVSICFSIVVALLAAAASTAPSRHESTKIVFRMTIGIAVYCAVIAWLVKSGLLERAFIPYGPMFMVGSVSIAAAMGFTRIGCQIATGLPVAWLVLFQGFRLPLELVLHDWYLSGTIPETMTWTGGNWDIVSGILACATFAFVTNRRWLAWVFNIFGILLLLNVSRVAVLSSAVPFGWPVDPPLELILHLPYAFIVPICVGGAALGHVLLTRRLVIESRASVASESS